MAVLLLAAVLGLVVVNYFSFDGALSRRPTEDQIRLAVAEAHRLARTRRETVFLRYEEATQSITLSNDSGETIAAFALPKDSDTTVSFFRILPESQFEEEPSFEAEEYSSNSVRFLPYGPSTPFIAELDQANELVVLRFDLFSSTNWKKTDAF